MGLWQLWTYLLTTAVLMVGALTIGASLPHQPLAATAGGLFCISAIHVGYKMAGLPAGRHEAAAVSARFARLIATAWGWSGAAMLSAYYLTNLSWQHAWQYGLAMLLIAAGLMHFARQRMVPQSPFSSPQMISVARLATGLQGAVALGAVAVLVLSGKIQADKADWAANVVFVAGGLAVAALSGFALLAERRTLSAPGA